MGPEVWAAIVAVIGTLGAALGTFSLQSRAQRRRDQDAGKDQDRAELRRVCAAFAAAAEDIRRLQIGRYKPVGDGIFSQTRGPLHPRIEEARAQLTPLQSELSLMTDDTALIEAAEELAGLTADFYELTNWPGINDKVMETAAAWRTFMAEARRVLSA